MATAVLVAVEAAPLEVAVAELMGTPPAAEAVLRAATASAYRTLPACVTLHRWPPPQPRPAPAGTPHSSPPTGIAAEADWRSSPKAAWLRSARWRRSRAPQVTTFPLVLAA